MIAKSITVLHTYPNKNRSSAAYAALLRTIRPAYPGMPGSYVVIRFLHDEIQHQRDAQHIQHRVYLLCIACQHLDQHVRQHAQADCRGDVAGEGAEQDHHEGTEAALDHPA